MSYSFVVFTKENSESDGELNGVFSDLNVLVEHLQSHQKNDQDFYVFAMKMNESYPADDPFKDIPPEDYQEEMVWWPNHYPPHGVFAEHYKEE